MNPRCGKEFKVRSRWGLPGAHPHDVFKQGRWGEARHVGLVGSTSWAGDDPERTCALQAGVSHQPYQTAYL